MCGVVVITLWVEPGGSHRAIDSTGSATTGETRCLDPPLALPPRIQSYLASPQTPLKDPSSELRHGVVCTSAIPRPRSTLGPAQPR